MDRSLSSLVLDELADSLILVQGDEDIRRVGTGIDDLGRLGVCRIKNVLLLLGQTNRHGSLCSQRVLSGDRPRATESPVTPVGPQESRWSRGVRPAGVPSKGIAGSQRWSPSGDVPRSPWPANDIVQDLGRLYGVSANLSRSREASSPSVGSERSR